ncbi:MAG TPA: hypothetical protein VFH68_21785 [Polyangia bacterium]|nr:hypothetical protein [Polyangia bacterium]
MRWALLLVLSLAAAAAPAACTSVELGDPPADVNACRPSQTFFVDQIWPNFLDKDYGGKRCADSACHAASAGRPLSLVEPTTPSTLPLMLEWAANYRSVTENMQCSNVRASALLTNPSGQVTHGGDKLIEPNGEEATLIEMWVTAP